VFSEWIFRGGQQHESGSFQPRRFFVRNFASTLPSELEIVLWRATRVLRIASELRAPRPSREEPEGENSGSGDHMMDDFPWILLPARASIRAINFLAAMPRRRNAFESLARSRVIRDA